MNGRFPDPPHVDPAVALQFPVVADLQRLHNWLGLNRPADFAAALEGETAVDVAIRLLARLPGS